MKLTALETQVMTTIPTNDFYEEGFSSVLWTDCLISSLEMDAKKARGVLSSLKRKGVLAMENSGQKDGDRDMSTVELTEIGATWLIENGITNDEGSPIKATETVPPVESEPEVTDAPEISPVAPVKVTRRNTITLAASRLVRASNGILPGYDWRTNLDNILIELGQTVDLGSKPYKALRRAIRREALLGPVTPEVINNLRLK